MRNRLASIVRTNREMRPGFAGAAGSSGFAIPTVLVLTSVLAVLAMTLLTQMQNTTPIESAEASRIKAKFLNLGGIDLFLLKIKLLPNEFYKAVEEPPVADSPETAELADKIRKRKVVFFDCNFNPEWENFPDDFYISELRRLPNKWHLGKCAILEYYTRARETNGEDFTKFIDIKKTTRGTNLETGVDTGIFEDDIFDITFEAKSGGVVRKVTQRIKMRREVIIR